MLLIFKNLLILLLCSWYHILIATWKPVWGFFHVKSPLKFTRKSFKSDFTSFEKGAYKKQPWKNWDWWSLGGEFFKAVMKSRSTKRGFQGTIHGMLFWAEWRLASSGNNNNNSDNDDEHNKNSNNNNNINNSRKTTATTKATTGKTTTRLYNIHFGVFTS